jgi:hypothetical protein
MTAMNDPVENNTNNVRIPKKTATKIPYIPGLTSDAVSDFVSSFFCAAAVLLAAAAAVDVVVPAGGAAAEVVAAEDILAYSLIR